MRERNRQLDREKECKKVSEWVCEREIDKSTDREGMKEREWVREIGTWMVHQVNSRLFWSGKGRGVHS